VKAVDGVIISFPYPLPVILGLDPRTHSAGRAEILGIFCGANSEEWVLGSSPRMTEKGSPWITKKRGIEDDRRREKGN